MKDILEKAASPQVVNRAWKRLRRDKAPWAPGIPRDAFENDIACHLLQLAGDLRSGRYRPDPVRSFTLAKGDGNARVISAHSLRDKVAQRCLLTVIEDFGEQVFHPDSYGYRPARNVDMAVAKAREYILCGLGWLVDADIESFFDNIPHSQLLRQLRKFLPDRRVVPLIRRWLDAGTVRRGFLGYARGVPQGAILSPFLCNVYLNSFDYDLTGNNLPFVRYADDFIVFARSRKDALRAHEFIAARLARLGLNLNVSKTRVTAAGPDVRFLGRRMPVLPGN